MAKINYSKYIDENGQRYSASGKPITSEQPESSRRNDDSVISAMNAGINSLKTLERELKKGGMDTSALLRRIAEREKDKEEYLKLNSSKSRALSWKEVLTNV